MVIHGLAAIRAFPCGGVGVSGPRRRSCRAAASRAGRGGPRVSETWTHTYPLSKTGEVTIVNANGRIEVEGVDGDTVEVQAEKIARGATEQIARDLLPRIPIDERATPDFVSVETRRINGFLIGASYEVRYRVKVPRSATLRATTVNGGVWVKTMDGRVIARTTNGGITATEMSGAVEARSVNGGVRVQFASLGTESVELANREWRRACGPAPGGEGHGQCVVGQRRHQPVGPAVRGPRAGPAPLRGPVERRGRERRSRHRQRRYHAEHGARQVIGAGEGMGRTDPGRSLPTQRELHELHERR